MEANQKIMDYTEELRKLNSVINFWKPKDGRYTVVFLSEPEDCEFTKEDGEVVKQWKFLVDVNKEQFVWTVPKSTSKTSVRGQLIRLGAKKGHLMGVSTEVIVQGSGKERRYTVPESL